MLSYLHALHNIIWLHHPYMLPYAICAAWDVVRIYCPGGVFGLYLVCSIPLSHTRTPGHPTVSTISSYFGIESHTRATRSDQSSYSRVALRFVVRAQKRRPTKTVAMAMTAATMPSFCAMRSSLKSKPGGGVPMTALDIKSALSAWSCWLSGRAYEKRQGEGRERAKERN